MSSAFLSIRVRRCSLEIVGIAVTFAVHIGVTIMFVGWLVAVLFLVSLAEMDQVFSGRCASI